MDIMQNNYRRIEDETMGHRDLSCLKIRQNLVNIMKLTYFFTFGNENIFIITNVVDDTN